MPVCLPDKHTTMFNLKLVDMVQLLRHSTVRFCCEDANTALGSHYSGELVHVWRLFSFTMLENITWQNRILWFCNCNTSDFPLEIYHFIKTHFKSPSTKSMNRSNIHHRASHFSTALVKSSLGLVSKVSWCQLNTQKVPMFAFPFGNSRRSERIIGNLQCYIAA